MTGWPLPDAERMLALAGARWTVRQTAWVGRLPAETGPRPEGMPRVLAQRPRGPLDVELVVARFVYDARGRATVGGSAADGRRATAQQGG